MAAPHLSYNSASNIDARPVIPGFTALQRTIVLVAEELRSDQTALQCAADFVSALAVQDYALELKVMQSVTGDTNTDIENRLFVRLAEEVGRPAPARKFSLAEKRVLISSTLLFMKKQSLSQPPSACDQFAQRLQDGRPTTAGRRDLLLRVAEAAWLKRSAHSLEQLVTNAAEQIINKRNSSGQFDGNLDDARDALWLDSVTALGFTAKHAPNDKQRAALSTSLKFWFDAEITRREHGLNIELEGATCAALEALEELTPPVGLITVRTANPVELAL